MNKMFHIYSEGENVLFREDADYIFFNNKFASSCHSLQLQPLAETTMSTHFHSLAETTDESVIDDFVLKLHKAYAMYYSHKYGFSIGNAFRISILELVSRESIFNELLYIMKNPVHHYVSSFPLEYTYSSAFYIFMDKLMPSLLKKRLMSELKQFGKLTIRQKKNIIGSDTVPDNWLVDANDMIIPSSYINIMKVRAFWNGNVKAFLFDINKNQTDAKKEVIVADVQDIRCSSMNDMDVCKVIDGYAAQAGRRSFHFLTSSEKQSIHRMLQQKVIPEEQIRRCLWL